MDNCRHSYRKKGGSGSKEFTRTELSSDHSRLRFGETIHGLKGGVINGKGETSVPNTALIGECFKNLRKSGYPL